MGNRSEVTSRHCRLYSAPEQNSELETRALDKVNEERITEGPALALGPVPTHMGYADATVDGEGCRQVLIEFAEPWSVNLVHQLGHTDDLWGPERG